MIPNTLFAESQIHHVALRVADVQASKAWFLTTLDFCVDREFSFSCIRRSDCAPGTRSPLHVVSRAAVAGTRWRRAGGTRLARLLPRIQGIYVHVSHHRSGSRPGGSFYGSVCAGAPPDVRRDRGDGCWHAGRTRLVVGAARHSRDDSGSHLESSRREEVSGKESARVSRVPKSGAVSPDTIALVTIFDGRDRRESCGVTATSPFNRLWPPLRP